MTAHCSLSGVALTVRDPEALASFYCTMLGMKRMDQRNGIAVGYGGQDAALMLKPASSGPAYQHLPDDRYWKIAITLPNLDLAHDLLTRKGISVTEPRQFREIAYMSHLSDPEGYVIELIQHTFDGKARTTDGDRTLPLGGGAQIGLITLRTNDIEGDLAHCRDHLGMAYLSRQTVTDRGFDLHFLALTGEQQPDPDVNAVENREWLWQRPYTSLEFQHRLDGAPIRYGEEGVEGDASVIINIADSGTTEFR